MLTTTGARDGLIVFWDAAETNRATLAAALTAAGLSDCVPVQERPHIALRQALLDCGDQFGMRVHGKPIEYKQTVVDDPERNCGFEAIRIIRSAKENRYDRLYTVETNGTNVVVVRNSPFVGWTSSHQWTTPDGHVVSYTAAAEAYLTERYRHYLDRLPGSTVGAVLKRAVTRHLHGVSLSRSGKAYYLPASSVGQYETLAMPFRHSEDLRFGWFRWQREDLGFEQIVNALRDEVTEVISVVQQDLQHCHDANRRLRADARENRMIDLDAAHAKLLAYEQALNVSVDELKAGIEHTQGLLAMNALLSVSA